MSSEIQLISSRHEPDHIRELRRFFNTEWGEGDPLARNPNGPPNLDPVIAIRERRFIGGLAFTWMTREDPAIAELYLNGVYVIQRYRRWGIATALINRACVEAAEAGVDEIFVFTDIPCLYTRIGWSPAHGDRGDLYSKRLCGGIPLAETAS